MPPSLLAQVADTLVAHAASDMATLAVALTDPEQLFDTHVVKVVADRDGYALYFSRATIPWKRDEFNPVGEIQRDWLEGLHRHLGIYAYRTAYLKGYADLEETTRRYDPRTLRDGWNDVGGERVFYVSNPALGLWCHRARLGGS